MKRLLKFCEKYKFEDEVKYYKAAIEKLKK